MSNGGHPKPEPKTVGPKGTGQKRKPQAKPKPKK